MLDYIFSAVEKGLLLLVIVILCGTLVSYCLDYDDNNK